MFPRLLTAQTTKKMDVKESRVTTKANRSPTHPPTNRRRDKSNIEKKKCRVVILDDKLPPAPIMPHTTVHATCAPKLLKHRTSQRDLCCTQVARTPHVKHQTTSGATVPGWPTIEGRFDEEARSNHERDKHYHDNVNCNSHAGQHYTKDDLRDREKYEPDNATPIKTSWLSSVCGIEDETRGKRGMHT